MGVLDSGVGVMVKSRAIENINFDKILREMDSVEINTLKLIYSSENRSRKPGDKAEGRIYARSFPFLLMEYEEGSGPRKFQRSSAYV